MSDHAGGESVGLRCAGAAALLVAAFLAYANSLSVPFFFDDPAAILENPTIRNLATFGEVLSPPSSGSGASGRPIVNLSLAINYAIGGTAVRGYHITNIALHALAGLMLFGIVRRTLLQPILRARFGRAAFPLALAGALVWTLHPLQTESVTCVIQRTELLVSLFYLLTLHAFIRAAEPGARAGWRLVAVLACFMGMASKEVMVSAPLMVLLYDRTFVAGSFVAALRARGPLYAGLGASYLLLGWLVLGMGGTRGEVAGFGVGVPWWAYALKQCEAILLYLKLTAWPHPLNVFYGVEVVTNPAEVWLEILGLATLIAVVGVACWRRPLWAFPGLWFFAILAPSSSVIPLVSQTVSEHRMHLPLAAPVVAGLAALYAVIGRRATTGVVAGLVALGGLTVRRNHDYRSELAIWHDTVWKAPANHRARANYALALQAAGRTAGAFAQFQEALRQNPNLPEALNNLATLLLDNRQPADAVEFCRRAIALKPGFAAAHNNLGTALVQTGRTAEGIEQLELALKLKPDLAQAHCNLASAYIELKRYDRAVHHAQLSVQQDPTLALAYFHLGLAHVHRHEPAQAKSAFEQAVRLKPDYADAHLNLGSMTYQAGDPRGAISHYEAAVRAKPDFVEAHNNLASALTVTGNLDRAIEHYRAAIRLKPTYAEAFFNLGVALAHAGRHAEAIEAFEAMLRLQPGDPRAKSALAQLRPSAR